MPVQYEEVVFMIYDECPEVVDCIRRCQFSKAMEILKQWHYPGEHMVRDDSGIGTEDKIHERDGYIMSWNPKLEYVGLTFQIRSDDE